MEIQPVQYQNLPVGAVLDLPALPFNVFWNRVMGISSSSAEFYAKEGKAPPCFLIGRHRYYLKADYLAWLESFAGENYSESRTYKPRKAAGKRGAK
jgi:hypothetical protein